MKFKQEKTYLFDSREISVGGVAGEFVVLLGPVEVDLWGTSGPASESSLVSSDRSRLGDFRTQVKLGLVLDEQSGVALGDGSDSIVDDALVRAHVGLGRVVDAQGGGSVGVTDGHSVLDDDAGALPREVLLAERLSDGSARQDDVALVVGHHHSGQHGDFRRVPDHKLQLALGGALFVAGLEAVESGVLSAHSAQVEGGALQDGSGRGRLEGLVVLGPGEFQVGRVAPR